VIGIGVFLAGLVPAYFLACYLTFLYEGLFPFLFISLLCQIFCSVLLRFLAQGGFFSLRWREEPWSVLLLAVAACLPLSAALISLMFPGLFDRRLLFMEGNLFAAFSGLAVVSTPAALWLDRRVQQTGLYRIVQASAPVRAARRNRAGLLLSLLFFSAYFIFAQSLNFPGFYTRDQYFETDISDWIARLAASQTNGILPVRAVHPAVLLFLRPIVWLLSLLLNADRLQAAFLLSAMAGAACVFIIWLIVKGRTGSTFHALLSASLLGASASHLLLSSMLETYIFSALALLAFCLLMHNDRTSLRSTVPLGIVIFGITVTNLAQACILYFLKSPRTKVVFQFLLAVVSLTLLLNILQVKLYPFAKPLYDPSNLLSEQKYGSNPFEARQWKERLHLIARSVLLYGVVAPTPHILKEELGATVPNFRTFKVANGELQVAGYKGFADIVAKTWIVLLGAAILLFVFDLFTSPRNMTYPISLALCMGFSFALHFLYGDDPMLYSPNWVYALVLFVSASFERGADKKWTQPVWIAFLGMMVFANLGLIRLILTVSIPSYGR
jgi:hypothetical protein